MVATSVYIHIPFCLQRCSYCDFNTYAGMEDLIPAYTQSVCREIEIIARKQPDGISIRTIYFGGGTPSLLSTDGVEHILDALRHNFQFMPSVEVTLEANPGTVSEKYLSKLKQIGINRLCLGMQSACISELQTLGRIHTYQDVVNAVHWSRRAGFENLSLDLIFGIPGQDVTAWMENIDAALSLLPNHLSLYALTLEENTPLKKKICQGLLPEPSDDVAADMYEAASEKLSAAGFMQYEISNWAQRGTGEKSYKCAHNLQYWRGLPYLGIGAGAHGFIENHRTVNILQPGLYIDSLSSLNGYEKIKFPKSPATYEITFIDRDTEIGEAMMMGLRLTEEGVSDGVFFNRYGLHLRDRYSATIERMTRIGLLEWAGIDGNTLRLTKRGRLLGNQVFAEFI